MNTQMIKCTCCGDDTDEHQAYTDPDLESPVCPECKINLRWAQAQLCRRTPQGVSITGIHHPRERAISYDPHISDAELKKLQDGQK